VSAPAAGGKVLLVVLDGFGLREDARGNAVAQARMPHLKGWMQGQGGAAMARLQASGLDVGLPRGVMGNSEVGHLALGTGRVVFQSLARIGLAIEDGTFATNPALVGAVEQAKTRGKPLHLLGLVSEGGVHSHLDHVLALLDLAAARGLGQVYVHAILDGRDTPPKSAAPSLERLEQRMAARGVGKLADVGGRFFGMDRDQRWERVRQHFDVLVHGKGPAALSWEMALQQAYGRGETDEFVAPTRLLPGKEGLLGPGEPVLLVNFRPDRMRQLATALAVPDFQGFPRGGAGPWPVTTMARYDEALDVPVAFPPDDPRDTLGEVVAGAGLRQLRIAETEKYAHVTYFFNGGQEVAYEGEERILVPSKREQPTYDLLPAMAAPEVTEALVQALREQDFALVVCNLANPDMVGHTGVLAATVQACEVVDACLGRIVAAARARGYEVLITADHGNAEVMEQGGQPHKAHTTNPVPLVLLGPHAARGLRAGGLADVAPTILACMGLPQPEAMTGASLLR
jgi:2,3-bisphosphoglycerate-independent phosphoglycerate mutase